MQKEKITFMQGTPTHLVRFLNHPDFKNYDISSFRLFATGGATIPPALVQRVMKETSFQLTIWFGMGEDIIHTAVWPEDKEEKFLSTVGKPLPGAELAIFDPEGKKLEYGEVGEIGFRGAAMFLGYFKNPGKTAETRNDQGWFLTGDTGFVDEDGYLKLYGRKKEMINRGGSKVFPLTIENVLCFYPKIQSIAVIGVPDPELGEQVCACIIPVKGETVTQEEIAVFMREKGFSKYEIPEKVKIMTEFPMTPTGKIKKDLLQKEVEEAEAK
jgi:acyl-CoA synthetase (AMP-forming)/AMP-acid ligase II